jgi:hypothetical protein
VAGTNFTATVAFSAASPIGGGTLLVVYPEGKVGFPVTGPVPPTYFLPLLPPQEVLVRGTDLDHALRVAIADGDPTEPVPVGPVAELRFQTCMSQPPPLPGEFQCYVIEMSDPVGNPVVTGVSCSVQVN